MTRFLHLGSVATPPNEALHLTVGAEADPTGEAWWRHPHVTAEALGGPDRTRLMTVQTFYRLAVWLPLLVPATVALAVHGLDLRAASTPIDKLSQLLLISGIYGGIPYVVFLLRTVMIRMTWISA